MYSSIAEILLNPVKPIVVQNLLMNDSCMKSSNSLFASSYSLTRSYLFIARTHGISKYLVL